MYSFSSQFTIFFKNSTLSLTTCFYTINNQTKDYNTKWYIKHKNHHKTHIFATHGIYFQFLKHFILVSKVYLCIFIQAWVYFTVSIITYFFNFSLNNYKFMQIIVLKTRRKFSYNNTNYYNNYRSSILNEKHDNNTNTYTCNKYASANG